MISNQQKRLLDSVEPENQHTIRTFFQDFCQKRLYESDAKPPQIAYKARFSKGDIRQYMGIFIKVDETVSFYCCRELQDTANTTNTTNTTNIANTTDIVDTAALKKENDHLKESMRNLVMQFSDSIAAFKLSPEGLVKPLYASKNVYKFFGYTKEEWLPLTERFTPVESFVAYSDVAYDDFTELLKNGEAEELFALLVDRKGGYITNYSWGETTLGELTNHLE